MKECADCDCGKLYPDKLRCCPECGEEDFNYLAQWSIDDRSNAEAEMND